MLCTSRSFHFPALLAAALLVAFELVAVSCDRTVEPAYDTQEVSGNIELPVGVPFAPDDLRVETVTLSSSVGSDGSFTVGSLVTEKQQLVLATLPSGNAVLAGVIDPAQPGSAQISARTSIKAMALLNPLLLGSSKEQRDQFLAQVEQQPDFESVVSSFAALVSSDPENALNLEAQPGLAAQIAALSVGAFQELCESSGGMLDGDFAPWVEDAPGEKIAFVNPTCIYYGAAVQGPKPSSCLIEAEGSIAEWRIGWPPVYRVPPKRTRHSLGNGHYDIMLTRGLDYSNFTADAWINWNNPEGNASLYNIGKLVFVIGDMYIGWGVPLLKKVPRFNWPKVYWTLNNLGMHLSSGDRIGVYCDMTTLMFECRDDIAVFIAENIGTDAAMRFLEFCTKNAGQIGLVIRGYSGMTSQLPFFLDLYNAKSRLGIEVTQEDGELKYAREYAGPNQPTAPVGPDRLGVGEQGTYRSSATHPDGSEVQLLFFWGDGEITYSDFVPSGTTVEMSYVYSVPGRYNVWVRAASEVGSSKLISVESPILAVVARTGSNTPPTSPGTPSGRAVVEPNKSYIYTAVATDPDNDDLQYKFSFGWVELSWTGFVPSGQPMSCGSFWPTAGSYPVKVKVRDIDGVESGWSNALLVAVGASGNSEPDMPTMPSGPTTGWVGVSYGFSSSANDPEGDQVAIRFDWGDGTRSDWSSYVTSGSPVTMSHVWSSPNTYGVTAHAKDVFGHPSNWSGAAGISIAPSTNQPPNTPSAPSGASSGKTDTSYAYSTSATDPDGDRVQYRFAWGDGDTSSWTTLVNSGSSASAAHTWATAGSYNIKAQAKDEHGLTSGWSSAKLMTVTGSSNRSPNTPTIPSGASSGKTDTSYTYSTSATDPDGDRVQYRFAWGDGDTSSWTTLVNSGSSASAAHTWSTAGSYNIKAQAKDEHGLTSGWSSAKLMTVTGSSNRPPNTPTTPSGPTSGQINTSYSFSSSATDPDGDQVAIRFDWGDGTQSSWSNLVNGGTPVTMQHSWGSPNTYTVTAKAKDVNGAESDWSSGAQIVISVQASWHQALASAPWHARYKHGCVTFGDRLLVFGGVYSNPSVYYYNDVWSSADGTNWDCLTPAASWSERCDFGVAVHNGSIWVMGGHGRGNIRSDVWRSSDGSNWTQVTADCPCPRDNPGMLSYGGKLWVFGGDNGSLPTRDVWYSTDGASWTQATAGAPWHRRQGHATVVFDNKMWILGGDTDSNYVFLSDVWSSTDGVVWSQVTGAAPWGPRAYHRAVVYNGKIWVIGGYNRDDAWSSADGVNWTQETSHAPWDARPWAGVTVMSSRIWLMGGWKGDPMGGHYANDVWYWP